MAKKRRIFIGFVLAVLMLWPYQAFGAQQKVMVIPLENNVEMGLSAYLERNFQIAEEEKADLIVIEMDTPGVLKLIDRGRLMIDIRIGSYKTGKMKGKPHDHGTGFRIRPEDLSLLYEHHLHID